MQDCLDQLDKSENLEKYRTAGNIVCKVLDKLIKLTKPNANIYDLCKKGDNCINNEVEQVYRNTKLEFGKGIAFPTCVSRNNYVGFYSPIEKEQKIEYGDIVNIELGVHIDGFPAIVGYTVVVNNNGEDYSDDKVKVVKAVIEASKNVLSLFKDGKKNTNIVSCVKETADKYNCNLLYMDNPDHKAPGVISYQVSQNIIYDDNEDGDGDDIHNIILNREREDYDFTMAETEFIENEVYVIDIAMSSGNGKINQTEDKTTIYKRNHNKRYNLKLKASKNAINKFSKNKFPVNIRDLNDTKLSFGLNECVNNGILEPFNVYSTKKDDYIAQVKFTVIVKRKKPILITGRSGDNELKKFE